MTILDSLDSLRHLPVLSYFFFFFGSAYQGYLSKWRLQVLEVNADLGSDVQRAQVHARVLIHPRPQVGVLLLQGLQPVRGSPSWHRGL